MQCMFAACLCFVKEYHLPKNQVAKVNALHSTNPSVSFVGERFATKTENSNNALQRKEQQRKRLANRFITDASESKNLPETS